MRVRSVFVFILSSANGGWLARRRRVSGSDEEEDEDEDEVGRVTPAPTRALPKRAA